MLHELENNSFRFNKYTLVILKNKTKLINFAGLEQNGTQIIMIFMLKKDFYWFC